MGPDLELKGRLEIVMEASACKENRSVVKELEDKHKGCASNFEDDTFDMQVTMDKQTECVDRSEDVEINISECTNSGDVGLVEDECQDATENSSSFGDTVSEVEYGVSNDAEVNSELRGDAITAAASDGYSEAFRMRRKLTSHWRTFIRPLMWRCRWVELQIKEVQSQAIKYDKELAEYNQRKLFELENATLEGFGAKSLPYSSQSRSKNIMKRKKRKRVDTVNIASYMSHHNLFSYYVNKRSAADGSSMDDDWGNLVISTDKTINGNDEFGVNDELLLLEFKDGDNSLEEILWKIGIVQSQVSKMKTRLHKVMSENAGRFSSTDKLSLLVPCNASTSSARNPGSPPNNGDRVPVGSSYIASQLISKYNMGDLVMPQSAVSSHGEGTHLPDIIESTEQPQVGGSCKNTGDGILIYNQRAKEELNYFEDVKIRPIEKPQVPKEEREGTIPAIPVLESDLAIDDQPTPKIRSISKLTAPKNKRKRGKRQAGSGRWSRRSSG
uniref:Uncharacterized protein n=1 Tax=Davidia involucrata TaxID=16924 RepID=A0A5B6ZUC1_DAVIN